MRVLEANKQNMTPSHVLLILIFAAAFQSINAHSHTCGDVGQSLIDTGAITRCQKLGALGAEFGWNYSNRTQNASSRVVDVFFRAPQPSAIGWVAWGVNPGPRAEMVGTRAILALKNSNGSIAVLPFNITGDTKRGCRLQSSRIEVEFWKKQVNFTDGNISMLVTLDFTSAPEYNLSHLNHVWQVGAVVQNGRPFMHGKHLENFDSRGTINLMSGDFHVSLHHRQRLRTVHGVLNIIGWGTILPICIIVARYFKIFPFPYDHWFRLHVPGQLLAYTIGTIGWGLGIALGNSSNNYFFRTHRILGIMVFAMASLQILALWLRPKRNDDYRKYWHIYHHFLGYSLFAVIAVNIFQGIHILNPAPKWHLAYVGILACLGFIAFVLETTTWVSFLAKTCRT
ncbi:hypothetical protein ACLOJK_011014 [Asimina triloba]